MAGRKKKKKSKSWFSFSGKLRQRKKPKFKSFSLAANYRTTLAILGVLCIGAGVFWGFRLLEKYVWTVEQTIDRSGPIKIDMPPWADNEPLKEKIANAAGGNFFRLDEETAGFVANNLQSIAWIYDVRVQTTDKTLDISAKYRKPVALVELKRNKYLLAAITPDDPLYSPEHKGVVVMDYLPVESIPIVEITGFSPKDIPPAGAVWRNTAVAAAVKLLVVLARMDEYSAGEKELLYEIAQIDVSNYDGRKSRTSPHTILRVKDGTPIYWGAAYGESRRHIEAKEEEKIASLYTFYKQHGTLQGIVKYIELRTPQKNIPAPAE